MTEKRDKIGETPSPKDFDESTGDRVEKKPQDDRSSQQTRDDEDQG